MSKAINSNLVTRTLSGVVLLVVVLLSVLLSQYSFAALMIVICVGASSEFYKISTMSGALPLRGYGITIGALIVLLNFLVAKGSLPMTTLVALIPFVMVIFIAELYRKSDNPIRDLSATLTGLVYVALPMSLMMWIGLRLGGTVPRGDIVASDISGVLLGDSTEYAPWVILSYIFIVWSNDIGAYLVGMTIGKRRLFERISPKKSWEGFFGGLVTAVIVGGIAANLMDKNIVTWALLGVVVSVSGVFGDLVESMFKRSVNIKDSGAIMPGHGGFLDRFDALLLSVPFVFVYFIIFTH